MKTPPAEAHIPVQQSFQNLSPPIGDGWYRPPLSRRHTSLPPHQQSQIFPTDLLFCDCRSHRTTKDVRLVSTLRSQSNHAESPAFSDHARNSSLISLRAALNLAPSTEKHLAVQASQNRRRPRGRRQGRDTQKCLEEDRSSPDMSECGPSMNPDTHSRPFACHGSDYNHVKASIPNLTCFIRSGFWYLIFQKPRHVTEASDADSQTRLDELAVVGPNEWKRRGSAFNDQHERRRPMANTTIPNM